MSQGFKTLCMTSERLREMFEGDFEDRFAEKCPLWSMGGWANPSSVKRRRAISKLHLCSRLKGNYSIPLFTTVGIRRG